jgi:hypothetical protein
VIDGPGLTRFWRCRHATISASSWSHRRRGDVQLHPGRRPRGVPYMPLNTLQSDSAIAFSPRTAVAHCPAWARLRRIAEECSISRNGRCGCAPRAPGSRSLYRRSCSTRGPRHGQGVEQGNCIIFVRLPASSSATMGVARRDMRRTLGLEVSTKVVTTVVDDIRRR